LKAHRKHTKLTAAAFGNFARNEWAIVGLPCQEIKTLAQDILAALKNSYSCIYLDTAHDKEKNDLNTDNFGEAIIVAESEGFQLKSTDVLSGYKYRQLLNAYDLVIVNGNHQPAAKQILIIDERKKESIIKHIETYKNIELLINTRGSEPLPEWVKNILPNWEQIRCIDLKHIKELVAFFEMQILQVAAPINGLVLAGGKSERLGYDKTIINWHGKPQKYYLADLMRPFCKEVYISCRAGQKEEIDFGYPTLEDTFTELGPYGAILSAFRHNPNAAWLVIASDLPLIDKETISYLIEHRVIRCIASTYESPFDGLPEPLLTIWEPKSYGILLHFLAEGISCPRKVLIHNNTAVLKAAESYKLENVNTGVEVEKIKRILPNADA